jgi:hypothetical protein
VSQPWIAKGERSSWLTHIAMTGRGSLGELRKNCLRFWNLKESRANALTPDEIQKAIAVATEIFYNTVN